MFDHTQRELRRLEDQTTIGVPIEADEEGYFDKECPSDDCLFQFKVFEEDWLPLKEGNVFCPSCRHEAPAKSWWTTEQAEQIKAAAIAEIQGRIGKALRTDAAKFNRRQPRKSFISMSLKVDSRPFHVPLPQAAECMQLKITCPGCQCRYAVIGSAFFCPACGHNAADQAFVRSLQAVRKSMVALTEIRAAIADRDTAENTVRLLIEGGLQNAVTAFQRFAEATFDGLTTEVKARRNAFQNLGAGSELWQQVTGKAYADLLSEDDLAALNRHFQKRHLLAHRQGIVDEEYTRKSGDQSNKIGQRIIVKDKDVLDCLDKIEFLGREMLATSGRPFKIP